MANTELSTQKAILQDSWNNCEDLKEFEQSIREKMELKYKVRKSYINPRRAKNEG